MDTRMLEKLLDASRQMAQTRVLEPLLEYTMRVALDLFLAEFGYLVLVLENGELDFRVRLDSYGNQLEEPESQISRTIFEKVIQVGESFVLTDAVLDPEFKDAGSVIMLGLRSVMCVPLIARDRVIGAIYVEDRSKTAAFDNDTLKPLEYFAAQAAVSIDNAMLNDHMEILIAQRTVELADAMKKLEDYTTQLEYEIAERKHAQEELYRLAITDPLTGVYNRRQFYLLASQVFKHARRYSSFLSALMIDADQFKQINDRYGHQVGDQALISLAKLLHERIRSCDILCRYGGEEFCILMPETNLEKAVQSAERLRERAASLVIESPAGVVQLTVSMGVASLSEDEAESVDRLLNRADEALYMAKNSGRNQVRSKSA